MDIPYILLDIWGRVFYNPDVLEQRVLAWEKGLINLDNLIKAGWEITEVNFPKKYIKKFVKECSKKKKRTVKEIVAYLYGFARLEEMKKQQEFCKKHDIDKDKSKQDWWLRGEPPPEYDPDETSYKDDEGIYNAN